MKNLDKLGFEFKVGDIVHHKLKSDKQKTLMLIVERMANECSGGVQLFYKCRVGINGYALTTFDPSKIFIVNEIELEEDILT